MHEYTIALLTQYQRWLIRQGFFFSIFETCMWSEVIITLEGSVFYIRCTLPTWSIRLQLPNPHKHESVPDKFAALHTRSFLTKGQPFHFKNHSGLLANTTDVIWYANPHRKDTWKAHMCQNMYPVYQPISGYLLDVVLSSLSTTRLAVRTTHILWYHASLVTFVPALVLGYQHVPSTYHQSINKSCAKQ